MHAFVLSVLLFITPSEDGTVSDGFEIFDVSSGVTADQLIPFDCYVDADTILDIDPGIIPEGDYRL